MTAIYKQTLFEADCLARFVTKGGGNLIALQLETSSGQQMTAVHPSTNTTNSLASMYGLSQENNPMEQMG
jgi:hypothetical protein